MNIPTIAVILATDRGRIAGFGQPRQFVSIACKPVVWYSLNLFENSPLVDCIVVVTNEESFDWMWGIVNDRKFSKAGMFGIIYGGETLSRATINAVSYCDREIMHGGEAKLLIHNAAWPLVTGKMIKDCVEALEKYDAVTTAVPMTDTVAITDENSMIVDIPKRNRMCAVQTPQGFKLSVLKIAYERAAGYDDFEATDNCGIVRKFMLGAKIGIVPGDEENIELTYPSDLEFIEDLLKKRNRPPFK